MVLKEKKKSHMKTWKCKEVGKYKCILTVQKNNSMCPLKYMEK